MRIHIMSVLTKARYYDCSPRFTTFTVDNCAFTIQCCQPRQELRVAHQGVLDLGLMIAHSYKNLRTKALRVAHQGILGIRIDNCMFLL
jgi:hypothetical protein